jgi:hypothetical protein
LCASPHPKLSWRLALQKVSNIRNHTFSQQNYTTTHITVDQTSSK